MTTEITFTDDELDVIIDHIKMLHYYMVKNHTKTALVDGTDPLVGGATAIDPSLILKMPPTLAWAKNVIDSKVSRIRLKNVSSDKYSDEVNQDFRNNNMTSESKIINTDALTYGTAYSVSTKGDERMGEPPVVHTWESPNTTYGKMNRRSRQLQSLIIATLPPVGDKKQYDGQLMLPDKDVFFTINAGGNKRGSDEFYCFRHENHSYGVRFEERVIHNRGFVAASQFVHNASSASPGGESALSKTFIERLTAAAMNMRAIEVHTNLYSHPTTVITGLPDEEMDYVANYEANSLSEAINESPLSGDEGDESISLSKPSNKSSVYEEVPQLKQGSIWSFGGNGKDYQPIDVKQLNTSSPKPLHDLHQTYLEDMAYEVGEALGLFVRKGENPQSADAINASQYIALSKARSSREGLEPGYRRMFQNGLALRYGGHPNDYDDVVVNWEPGIYEDNAVNANMVIDLIKTGAFPLDANLIMKLGYSEVEAKVKMDEINNVLEYGIVDVIEEDESLPSQAALDVVAATKEILGDAE